MAFETYRFICCKQLVLKILLVLTMCASYIKRSMVLSRHHVHAFNGSVLFFSRLDSFAVKDWMVILDYNEIESIITWSKRSHYAKAYNKLIHNEDTSFSKVLLSSRSPDLGIRIWWSMSLVQVINDQQWDCKESHRMNAYKKRPLQLGEERTKVYG